MLDDAEVYAYRFSGDRYDCGNKLGYLQATVAYGLAHDEVGNSFDEYLRNILGK
jgi:UTP--glucose-1-phosphate uridylyltransferase